ncbi:unnamed protein product, partial [Rotaria socialis]
TTLANLHHSWEKKLLSLYEIYNDLTYFAGDQFQLIEDYIYNSLSVTDPGYHLLRCIDIDPKSIRKLDKTSEQPEDRLENLGNLLSKSREEV